MEGGREGSFMGVGFLRDVAASTAVENRKRRSRKNPCKMN